VPPVGGPARQEGGSGALGWYANRLRSMGPAEVAWRVRREIASRVAGARRGSEPPDSALLASRAGWDELLADFRASRGRPLILSRERVELAGRHDADGLAEVISAAARARERRFAYFGYPEVAFGDGIDWSHGGPGAASAWPLLAAERIDYRRQGPDPKWVWELNRLQHLTWLAQAWLAEGDERAAEEALDQIDGWIGANPVGMGVSWHGGFEPGIRAVTLCLALQGLRDAPALTPDRYRRAVRALAAMAGRSWSHRSLHSSANNHLLGEMAGVLAVSVMFPELRHAPEWRRRATRMLAREAARQVLSDGAGAEQAFPYQVFSGDLLLLAAVLARATGLDAPAVVAALERGAGFMAGVLGDDDPAPRYGDDDDGFAIRLGAGERRDPRGHLGAVAALTGNPAARRAGRLDLTAAILLGDEGARRFATTPPGPGPGSFVAPQGGLVVLRSEGRRVTFDTGPLGYLSIAAHGHADALAVTLSAAGREIVGDPGPASYFGHPGWRAAHRSTRAHATVTVDGLDQSVSGGPFMWTRHATARLLAADPGAGSAVAEHSGYLRLRDPVLHRRAVMLAEGLPLVVVDSIAAAGEHDIAVSWPLHPDLDLARPSPAGGGFALVRDGAPVARIAHGSSDGPLHDTAVRGDVETDLGWWSDRLEERRPSWLVGGRLRTAGSALVATLIWSDAPPAGPVDVSVTRRDGAVAVSWTEGGRAREVTLALPPPA
jgi:hypothetical protein